MPVFVVLYVVVVAAYEVSVVVAGAGDDCTVMTGVDEDEEEDKGEESHGPLWHPLPQ